MFDTSLLTIEYALATKELLSEQRVIVLCRVYRRISLPSDQPVRRIHPTLLTENQCRSNYIIVIFKTLAQPRSFCALLQRLLYAKSGEKSNNLSQ